MASQEKTRKQAVAAANAFRDWFATASVYAFIGRVTPLSSSSSSQYTTDNRSDLWDGMYALKKLSASDVSHVIPINTWVTSTTYDMYRNDTEMATASSTLNYFVSVINGSDMHVYKCISNGADYDSSGDASTVSPYTAAGTSTTINAPAGDNYRWKFMYTIPNYATNKFYNASWLPVARTGTTGSAQATVTAAATDRSIDHIKVTAEGSGYTTATVTITGDGSGATATATISSGEIIAITMTNVGSGYTNASVSISGDGSGATAEAILSPKWGHGYDPVNELAANSAMVIAEFDGDEGGVISTANDYRQYGLVVNPTLYGTKTVATGDVYSQATVLNITGTGFTSGTYSADDLITGDTSIASGYVLEWEATTATTGVLTLVNVYGDFQATETINASSHTIASTTNPDLEHGSGEIIMSSDISPISRSDTQKDRLRMVFTF